MGQGKNNTKGGVGKPKQEMYNDIVRHANTERKQTEAESRSSLPQGWCPLVHNPIQSG